MSMNLLDSLAEKIMRKAPSAPVLGDIISGVNLDPSLAVKGWCRHEPFFIEEFALDGEKWYRMPVNLIGIKQAGVFNTVYVEYKLLNNEPHFARIIIADESIGHSAQFDYVGGILSRCIIYTAYNIVLKWTDRHVSVEVLRSPHGNPPPPFSLVKNDSVSSVDYEGVPVWIMSRYQVLA